ncbi:MAG TPA: hypothetical protein DCZ23_04755 [Lachnospiraceae bacterium]|nr:hypothetical protein [Lachnospiraceae bacterium]
MGQLGKWYRAVYILLITVTVLFMADTNVTAAELPETVFSPQPSPSGTVAEPSPETEPTAEPAETPDTVQTTAPPSAPPSASPSDMPSAMKPSSIPSVPDFTGLDAIIIPKKDNTGFNISVKKAGKDRLAVSWPKRKYADKYKVWRKIGSGAKWKLIKTTKGIKYSDKVKTGKYYKYKVTAIFGKKRVIGTTKAITACIPDKVSAMGYKRTATNKIDVLWKRGNCTKEFIVYKKGEGGGFKKAAVVKNAKYEDSGIVTGKKYIYKIVPVYYNEKVRIYGSNAYTGVLLRDEINTGIQKYSYTELCSDIKALKKLYGRYFHYNTIGRSADGRNIYDLVIGNQHAGQSVLVIAELHAREYMTSQLCMKQIEYYLQNYNEQLDGVLVSDVLNKVAIHYVPMANPDGASISQYGFSAVRNTTLRKKLLKMPGSQNPSQWKANARGVDLNRNYPYEYVARSGRRSSEGYTGPEKCSEPETKAITGLINKLKNSTTVRGQINYHATGSIVFGDYEGPLKETITDMYKLACSITGYASASGYSKSTGGDSTGNLREFVMYKKKLPSITLEIGKSACPLPLSEFNGIWQKNKSLVLLEAKLLAK